MKRVLLLTVCVMGLLLIFTHAHAAKPMIVTKYYHTMALKSDGTVWGWGNNQFGKLGDGTSTTRLTPTPVTQVSDVASIETGWRFTLALKSDGTVWGWGRNASGQLGSGVSYSGTMTPVEISSISDVAAIAAGGTHAMAVKSDGSVWGWGDNDYGALGDGTNQDKKIPNLISAISGVNSITAGWHKTVALKPDATVWAWGYNKYGQLGDGTTDDKNEPIPVWSGLSDVISISTGNNYHVAAVKSDGTVWTWGWNGDGGLGDGTTDTRTVPVPVPGLSGVTAVATGGGHTVALKSDGTVWAWGKNEFGQLGDGTTTKRLSPVMVSQLSDVTAIAAGTDHTIAVKSDGSVWAWGDNQHGQLGDGTTDVRTQPVQVVDIYDPSGFLYLGTSTPSQPGSGTVWYYDGDDDGYGDPNVSLSVATQPAGYVADNTDCDDTDDTVNPGAVEIAGDGIDQDCDGSDLAASDTWYYDGDNDGYGDPNVSLSIATQPAGYVSDNTDCDDTDDTVNPGAVEIAGDGIDQDCDGSDKAGSGSGSSDEISILSPSDNETVGYGASGGKVTFSFSKITDAAKYVLNLNLYDILSDNAISVPVELTSSSPGFSETFIGMVYELTLDTATWDVLALYDIQWGVEAYNDKGSLVGSTYKGSVASQQVNNLKFVASNAISMTSPANGSELDTADSAPSFQWETYQGASTYLLVLAHVGTLGFDTVITKDSLTLNVFPMDDPTWQTMPTGTWYWTVLGYDAAGSQIPYGFTLFDFEVQ